MNIILYHRDLYQGFIQFITLIILSNIKENYSCSGLKKYCHSIRKKPFQLLNIGILPTPNSVYDNISDFQSTLHVKTNLKELILLFYEKKLKFFLSLLVLVCCFITHLQMLVNLKWGINATYLILV